MKRTLVLPALLLLAACGDSPAELFAKANQAYAAHDYTAARLHIASALKEDGGNREMLLLQARTLLALGDGEGARAALEKLAGSARPAGEIAEMTALAAVLRRKPDVALEVLTDTQSIEADRLRAVASLQKQDLAAAEQFLTKAVAAGGSSKAFADFARLHLIRNDLDKATLMAERATKAGPDELSSLLVAGEIAARKGDLERALGYFSRADKLYPANVAAMTGKAAVLGELGRTEAFEAALAPLVQSVPDNPDVTFLRARLALQKKDWSAVRKIVQPLESNLSQQDPLRLVYAEALLGLGQAEQAMAQARPIARTQPDNRHAVRLLAEAQLAAGDAAGALRSYAPIGRSSQARPEELALMAKIAAAAKSPDAAALADAARRPAPQALAADLAEGDAAMRRQNWARAVTAYDRIMAATDGRNPIVLNNLAYAQSMLGNHAKAKDLAARALKAAPDNPSILDTAGWVQFRAGGNLAEAKRLLRLAAEKAPQNQTIRAHLAEVERQPG